MIDFEGYINQWRIQKAREAILQGREQIQKEAKDENLYQNLMVEIIGDKKVSDEDAKEFLLYLINSKGFKIDSDTVLLHEAARYGRGQIVTYLVEEKHINVNSQPASIKNTPLHQAVIRGAVDIVKYLINNGADTKIKNNSGETPLHYAVNSLLCHQNQLTIVSLLLSGEDSAVNIPDNLGETPLHCGLGKNKQVNLEVIKLLVKNGANISDKDRSQSTPLHCAASSDHWDVALWLLEQAPQHDNSKNSDGKTPLDYVLDKNDESRTQLFVRKQLINDLKQYIKNITLKDSNPNIDELEDFKQVAFRFSFFKDSQAINRRANYRLAVKMIEDLQKEAHEKPLSIVFDESNIKTQRATFGATRGINSTELNEIINRARAPIDHSERGKISRRM